MIRPRTFSTPTTRTPETPMHGPCSTPAGPSGFTPSDLLLLVVAITPAVVGLISLLCGRSA